MPYATLADVQTRMPQFQVTATSKPSTDTVSAFLTVIAADVDAVLSSLKYVVPLTNDPTEPTPLWASQIKTIVCDGVIARTLYARAAAVGGEAAYTSADRAQKLYDAAMARLSDHRNPMVLHGAKRTMSQPEGKNVGWRSGGFGFVPDDDVADEAPRATVGQVF